MSVGRRVAVALAVAALVLAGFPSPASADSTEQRCDINSPPKYWCVWVSNFTRYTEGQYVHVGQTTINGARNGGARRWQLFISALWRQDPSTGQWYYHGDWCPCPWYYNIYMNEQYHSTFPNYNLGDIADVQMKARFIRDTDGKTWCGDVIDFELTWNPVRIYRSGAGAPCEPE